MLARRVPPRVLVASLPLNLTIDGVEPPNAAVSGADEAKMTAKTKFLQVIVGRIVRMVLAMLVAVTQKVQPSRRSCREVQIAVVL